MKSTVEIPNPLFRRIKVHAAMEGLKLKEVVAFALSAYLTQPRPPSKNGTRPCPFPLVRGKTGRLMKEMCNEMIAQLQEKEDIERHRRYFGR
jgi:hypothetical protein